MVLRVVSGPMSEKSSKTRPLADRQKVLLTAYIDLMLPFFSNFQLPGKREIFKKFLGNLRDSENSREIFAGKFFELDYFDIFSGFQQFRFNF